MCMTFESLAAFLALLSADIVDTAQDRVIIRAEAEETVWVATGEVWCLDGADAGARVDRAFGLPGRPG